MQHAYTFLASKVLCQYQQKRFSPPLVLWQQFVACLNIAAKVQILLFDWHFVNSLLVVLQPKYFHSSHCLNVFYEVYGTICLVVFFLFLY